jgi:hypothetical protein
MNGSLRAFLSYDPSYTVRSPVLVSCFRLNDTLLVLLLSSDRERKSSRPLIVSLALELLSRNLRRTPSNSSTLERQEYARRDRDLFWYLFRGSIWESWTRYGAIINHLIIR